MIANNGLVFDFNLDNALLEIKTLFYLGLVAD